MPPTNIKAFRTPSEAQTHFHAAIQDALDECANHAIPVLEIVVQHSRFRPHGVPDEPELSARVSFPTSGADAEAVANRILDQLENRSPGHGFLGQISVAFWPGNDDGDGSGAPLVGNFEVIMQIGNVESVGLLAGGGGGGLLPPSAGGPGAAHFGQGDNFYERPTGGGGGAAPQEIMEMRGESLFHSIIHADQRRADRDREHSEYLLQQNAGLVTGLQNWAQFSAMVQQQHHSEFLEMARMVINRGMQGWGAPPPPAPDPTMGLHPLAMLAASLVNGYLGGNKPPPGPPPGQLAGPAHMRPPPVYRPPPMQPMPQDGYFEPPDLPGDDLMEDGPGPVGPGPRPQGSGPRGGGVAALPEEISPEQALDLMRRHPDAFRGAVKELAPPIAHGFIDGLNL